MNELKITSFIDDDRNHVCCARCVMTKCFRVPKHVRIDGRLAQFAAWTGRTIRLLEHFTQLNLEILNTQHSNQFQHGHNWQQNIVSHVWHLFSVVMFR
jgi:hypothetical protein